MNRKTDAAKNKLWNIVSEFVKTQEITCPETICQSDRVIENAYDLIEELCDVVGYHEYED